MIEKPKTAEILENSSQGYSGRFRSKLAIALMTGLSMTGCGSDKMGEITPSGSAATSAVSAKETRSATPERNVCDERIKTDPNIKKYPRVSQANIQKVLDKFPGARTTIEDFSGNGCRDTVIFVPAGFDAGKKIELQYFFHGSLGNFINVPMPYDTKLVKKGKWTGAEERFTHTLSVISKKVEEGGRNTILVYPLSAGRREKGDWFANSLGFDDQWMKKGNDIGDDMVTFDHQVKESVQTKFGIGTKEATVTLSGHSAGGRPIMHAVQSGFMPDKIKFLEATYNDWANVTQQKIESEGGDIQIEVFFKPQSETEKSANALNGKKNVTIAPIEGMKHREFVDFI